MPRRIIYIKNPTSGSHFRTIGGSSQYKNTAIKPRTNTQQTGGPQYDSHGGYWTTLNGRRVYISGTHTSLGGTHFGYTPGGWDVDWKIGDTPDYIAAVFGDTTGGYPPPMGTLPDYGIGPYDNGLALPDRETYYARDIKLWEVAAGFAVLGGIFFGVFPAMVPAAEQFGWGSAMKMVTAQAQASWKANVLSYGIDTFIFGLKRSVNDSTYIEWDKQAGDWVTRYPDLSSWLEDKTQNATYDPQDSAGLRPGLNLR